MNASEIKDSAYVLPEMIPIKGGMFTIGDEAYEDSQPLQQIEVPDFRLGKYPVTNAEFVCFMRDYRSATVKAGPYQGQEIIEGDSWSMQRAEDGWFVDEQYKDHPVINVSWYGANAYAEWLSQKSGNRYRLPSESEWEYAARGGQQSKFFKYAGSNNIKEVAWFNQNSPEQTLPVGLKKANELGLHDMSGNVREWCADHWRANYNDIPKDGRPYIDPDNFEKDYFFAVVRGGSWNYINVYCRVSYRFNWLPYNRNSNVGFRLCGY